jgi:nucleotide-binding universal stress UspA family protein
MYNTILLPLTLDQSLSARLIERAKKLKTISGKIIVVHVIDPISSLAINSITQKKDDQLQKSAEMAMQEQIGDDKNTLSAVLTGHPGRSITDYAAAIGADCIIVGSHRLNIKSSLPGSTTERIKREANCPVHVLN